MKFAVAPHARELIQRRFAMQYSVRNRRRLRPTTGPIAPVRAGFDATAVPMPTLPIAASLRGTRDLPSACAPAVVTPRSTAEAGMLRLPLIEIVPARIRDLGRDR